MKTKLAGYVVGLAALSALAGCVSTGSPFGYAGGPSPDMPTLLERIPAQTPADEASLKADLLRCDADAIRSLCEMLVEPGTGDDTKPRMALHALAIHVASREGRSARRRYVEVLGSSLESELSVPAKRFVIQQLEYAGDARAVGPLGRCLTVDGLCVPATRSLLTIASAVPSSSRKVASLLRGAFSRTKGVDRMTVINALGRLGDAKSVGALLNETTTRDAAMRSAALDALAHCGDLRARKMIASATRVTSLRERSHAIDRLITFARSLDARGRESQAAAILRKLIAEYEDGAAVHVHCAALEALADVLGDRAIDEVMAAMDSENPQLRAAATKLAATMPGKSVTRALTARMKTAGPAGRVGLLDVLCRRGDRSALSAALTALNDSDSDVRVTAIAAAARLGGSKVVDDLLGAMETDIGPQRLAARDALCRISGARVAKTVANAVSGASPQMKIDLLTVLAGRAAVDHAGTVFAASRDENEAVRIAAIGALEVLAQPDSTPVLIALIADAASDEEREALESALAATVKRSPDVPALVATVIDAVDGQSTPVYCSLLRVLGRVGGAEPLAKVISALDDDRTEAIETAVRTLADWPDAAAVDVVLAIARDTSELTHNVLALRGYARLLGLDSDREAETTLSMFESGIAAARRPDEIKLLLAGVGGVKAVAALAILDPYLDDEALRGEAAVALVGVAEAVVKTHWQQCKAHASRVLAADVPEELVGRARVVLDQAVLYEGHITDWQYAGPYTEGKKTGSQMFAVAFPPEEDGAGGIEWQRYPVDANAGAIWRIDLKAVLDGEDAVAYLRTRVFSPTAQGAVLEVGSDDGIKVWFNGAIVIENNAGRGSAPAQDRSEVALTEGWNDLLLKVTNNGGTWNACARFRGLDAAPLEGVYSATGETTGKPAGD